MARKMALAAVGRDCPGIVSAVSRVLFQHGCNLEDSSMTILRGEFAMILIVAVPQESSLDALRSDLERAADHLQLVLSFRELPDTQREPSEPGGLPYILSVYGADHPGIVARVTELLADNNINITDVNTRVVGGKDPVYIMLLEVEVPERLSPDVLSDMLSRLAQELRVEITFRPLETANL